MIKNLFRKDPAQHAEPKEGDLYKILLLSGKSFELRYGYYEEFERQYNEPMPIYPDFIKNPVYTEDGTPFVTKMQDACIHYSGKDTVDRECAGCAYYMHGDEFLGLCACPHNKKTCG